MTDSNDPRSPRPFSAGFAWLNTAAALLKGNAARLLLIGLLFQLLGSASQMGILGLLFVLAAPALTAGMLQAVHLAASGGRPTALHLFAAFQGGGRLLSLFLLGGLTIVAVMLVVGFFVAGSLANLDPALAARIQAGDQNAVLELDPALIQRVLFSMLFGLLLGACLSFFAVPLIWFQQRSLGDALWTGISALFRQWRALTALGIGLAAIGIPVGMVVAAIMAAHLASGSPSVLLSVVLMLVVVVYQVLAFCAQYVAFADVFMRDGAAPRSPSSGDDDPRNDGGDDAGNDDQLVA